MRRTLSDPESAIEALSVKELALRKKIIAWCLEFGDEFQEQIDHDRAAVAILESGPTIARWQFVMEPDEQWNLINGVRGVAGLWSRKNGTLEWVAL